MKGQIWILDKKDLIFPKFWTYNKKQIVYAKILDVKPKSPEFWSFVTQNLISVLTDFYLLTFSTFNCLFFYQF